MKYKGKHLLLSWGGGASCSWLPRAGHRGPPALQATTVPSLSSPLPCEKGKIKGMQTCPGPSRASSDGPVSNTQPVEHSQLPPLRDTQVSTSKPPCQGTHSLAPSSHHSHIKTYLAGPQEAGTQGWFQSIKAGRAKEKGGHQRTG